MCAQAYNRKHDVLFENFLDVSQERLKNSVIRKALNNWSMQSELLLWLSPEQISYSY